MPLNKKVARACYKLINIEMFVRKIISVYNRERIN